MPRLTDTTIQNAKIGEHSDAQTPGLIFVVRASTSKAAPRARRRFWIYRFTLDGKRLKMGLGAYPAVTLEDARKKAKNAASKVANGADPRRTRRPDPASMSFHDAAEAYLTHALPRLAGAKSRHSLQHALRVHARSFHNRTVADIGTRDVASLLKSIPGPYLAKRVRSALRGLFASVAIDMEDRGLSMRNPVSTDGLKAASYVPSSSNAHHPALDPAEAPAFMNALRAIPTMDARLLEFTILTVARAGAARAARFDQIDIGAAVWRVPPEQLKDRAHRTEAFLVPLSPRALAIVEEMRAIRPDSTLIFAGAGDTTLIKLMRRMCREQPWRDPVTKKPVSTHGFRATFRTHFQDPESRHSREVVEIAMGHRFHGVVEGAYARGELLNERRKLLNDWARYLEAPTGGAEIIPLRA